MSIHIHRNSFNAGEISPLMDARVDEAKHPFSCRVLENFIPKIYGGAFRRPGTMYLGRDRLVSEWTELPTSLRHDLGIFFGGENAAPTSNTGYEVGAIYLRNVRTVYKCTNGAAGTWAPVTEFSDLYASENPTTADTTARGFATGSVIFVRDFGAIWTCTNATTGAWSLVTLKTNVSSTDVPTTFYDEEQGYKTGSYWVRNVYTVYRIGVSPTWQTVSGTHQPSSNRNPTPGDGTSQGFAVGSIWINNREGRVFELTNNAVSAPVRLIDLNVSATIRYQLEFGAGYLRIWQSSGALYNFGANPLVVQTPYSGTEIFEVQMAQVGNLAYFTHPNHPPQKLSRYFIGSSEFFQWSEVQWSFPCFRDWNTSKITATPSATTGNTKTITLNAQPLVEVANYSEYIGARIALSQRRAASHQKLDLVTGSVQSTTGISILGQYQFYTTGQYTGTVSIEQQNSAGAWEVVRSFEAKNDRQIVFSSATEKATTLRITRSSLSAAVNSAAYLEAGDSRRVGYARILRAEPTISGNDYVTVFTVDIEQDFDSTLATTEWALEAWATYSGYPRSICFHEQRLWFGGTELQPNTLWASVTNNFENFRRGAYDTDALAFTLAATEGSAIQSMVSHQSLVIFTQSEEWTASTSEQTAITPSNIFVRRQSRFGSAHKQAFVAANNLLFLQRGARKVRQFTYSGGGAQGQASDLTLLAEHVTRSGIRQVAFQQQPDPIIWAVTTGGVLLSLTYESDQNVIAWARHTSGTGLFESVSVIYGDDGKADEVWVVVNRQGIRMIERIDAEAFTKLEQDDTDRMIYLDSALLLERTPASTSVTGLGHLNGKTVGILADGAIVPSKVVSSGSITLDVAASKVVVGLPYTSTLQPSKVEMQMQNGPSQGRKHLCKNVTLNLWKTFGLEIADTPNAPEDKWFPVTARSTETALGDPEPLVTGFIDAKNLGAHNRSVDVSLRQRLPLPCNILAMIPQIEISPT